MPRGAGPHRGSDRFRTGNSSAPFHLASPAQRQRMPMAITRTPTRRGYLGGPPLILAARAKGRRIRVATPRPPPGGGSLGGPPLIVSARRGSHGQPAREATPPG